jgi:hypothetical protein
MFAVQLIVAVQSHKALQRTRIRHELLSLAFRSRR